MVVFSTDYLADASFKCDLFGQKDQAGGSGKCTFSMDQVTYKPIPDFPVGWCSSDAECRQAVVRNGLNCAGPRMATVVRGNTVHAQ